MIDQFRTVYRGGTGEIVEKKSRFIATVRLVESEEEALSCLEALRKKYWDARHNCFVYIIGENQETVRCSDDGEPSGTAGRPMLDVVQGAGLRNVLVVVTRYFGGTLLGTGGLVRAYSQAVQEGLANSVLIDEICGVLLFAATTLQQFGLLDTTVGKSGFVTALYIVFVPILGALMGRRAGLKVWLCALAAVFGMYLLCVGSGFSVSGGDLLTLGCAVLFAIHICYVGAVVPHMDGVRLSCVQFLVCSALSAVGMLLFEAPDWGSILQCWWPIVYAGVFSGGVAYTFQIIGERDVQPTLASLLMSLESVFAALFGWLLLDQTLSARELFGCAVMFAAIILSQLPERQKGAV